MKTILDKDTIRIAYGALENNKENRLRAVKIGNDEIVASNGFLLIRKPLETEGENEVLVCAEDILKLRIVNKKAVPQISITEQNGTIEIDNNTTTLISKIVEGNYPKLDTLYPKEKRTAFIAINLKLFAKLIKIVGEDTIVKFRIRGKNVPIEFIAKDFSGLIMPMFITETDELWHKEK